MRQQRTLIATKKGIEITLSNLNTIYIGDYVIGVAIDKASFNKAYQDARVAIKLITEKRFTQ